MNGRGDLQDWLVRLLDALPERPSRIRVSSADFCVELDWAPAADHLPGPAGATGPVPHTLPAAPVAAPAGPPSADATAPYPALPDLQYPTTADATPVTDALPRGGMPNGSRPDGTAGHGAGYPPPSPDGSAPAAALAAPAQPAADPGHAVRSPSVGTFYRAPEPGGEPFVALGSQVSAGQQVGIVEAMKLMIPVESDRAGTVVSFCVDDGHQVEYGAVLLLLQGQDG